MVQLDRSQLDFCRSEHQNIRLLAPAGCGKTVSLLYRCRELLQRSSTPQRFLIVAFTNSAVAELKARISAESDFKALRGNVTITTLNAYGWRYIGDRVANRNLLNSNTARHFAMMNQLKPTLEDFPHVAETIRKRGNRPRRILDVMDNLKSMGFDHTVDTSRSAFEARLCALQDQGLAWRIRQQFEDLTSLGILEVPRHLKEDAPSTDQHAFYDKFFQFWLRATDELLRQSTFTFEDQKYWTYIELNAPSNDGKPKPSISGAARYQHVLVDEFQDINPLDLKLIDTIARRHQSTLTIVGDDDQAIYEWCGASPEYILNPSKYLHKPFVDYQLQVNYRSPAKIINASQNLIQYNMRRVKKRVIPAPSSGDAKIEMPEIDGINDQLKVVTEIVRSTQPGRVAVIGRFRRQLIPFQIAYASDGAPFKTSSDLDIYASDALDNMVKLLDIREYFLSPKSSHQAIDDAISIFDLIKRYPLNQNDRSKVSRHLRTHKPRTTSDAIDAMKSYDGPKLSGKSHLDLVASAHTLLHTKTVANAIEVIANDFDGLRFDRERAENDIWFSDPPLNQLAEIADKEQFSTNDIIERIEFAKDSINEYSDFERDDGTIDTNGVMVRPLHLMTAHRAKGKEFETVIILDSGIDKWPDEDRHQRQIEAERRLFYVAFTRALKRVVMFRKKDQINRFQMELLHPNIYEELGVKS